MLKTFRESDIKMQGSLSPEEIKSKIEAYTGSAASCDLKYKPYVQVGIPRVDKYRMTQDILNLLKL